MKNLKIAFSLIALVLLFSCSKDNETASVNPVDNFSTMSITTKQPILASDNLSISSGGVASFNVSNNSEYQVGVCYSENANPTTSNNILYSSQANGGDFSCILYSPVFGQNYYLRAYVLKYSTGEVKYGNEVSILIPLSLTTDIVKNISITGFSVGVNVGNSLSSNDERGICYSTSQNPTINNNKISDATFGSGNFTISIDGNGLFTPFYYVNANTTYYLKSYVRINGNYYYGNQMSFKTAGYTGGSGGYVFFDKGETTNGWRYLEAAPQNLIASGNSSFRWISTSCTQNTFLSGISTGIGTGLENSQIIKNFCNYTSVAGTMCVSTSLNGQTNWFLPSIDELKEMYKLKHTNLTNLNSVNYTLSSSSQSSNSLCYVLNTSNFTVSTVDKTLYHEAWQVRRF
jgi:parallel beta-helix repeat protein